MLRVSLRVWVGVCVCVCVRARTCTRFLCAGVVLASNGRLHGYGEKFTPFDGVNFKGVFYGNVVALIYGWSLWVMLGAPMASCLLVVP